MLSHFDLCKNLSPLIIPIRNMYRIYSPRVMLGSTYDMQVKGESF